MTPARSGACRLEAAAARPTLPASRRSPADIRATRTIARTSSAASPGSIANAPTASGSHSNGSPSRWTIAHRPFATASIAHAGGASSSRVDTRQSQSSRYFEPRVGGRRHRVDPRARQDLGGRQRRAGHEHPQATSQIRHRLEFVERTRDQRCAVPGVSAADPDEPDRGLLDRLLFKTRSNESHVRHHVHLGPQLHRQAVPTQRAHMGRRRTDPRRGTNGGAQLFRRADLELAIAAQPEAEGRIATPHRRGDRGHRVPGRAHVHVAESQLPQGRRRPPSPIRGRTGRHLEHHGLDTGGAERPPTPLEGERLGHVARAVHQPDPHRTVLARALPGSGLVAVRHHGGTGTCNGGASRGRRAPPCGGDDPALTYFRLATIIGPGCLTAVFGMGTGVSSRVWAPGIRFPSCGREAGGKGIGCERSGSCDGIPGGKVVKPIG